MPSYTIGRIWSHTASTISGAAPDFDNEPFSLLKSNSASSPEYFLTCIGYVSFAWQYAHFFAALPTGKWFFLSTEYVSVAREQQDKQKNVNDRALQDLSIFAGWNQRNSGK